MKLSNHFNNLSSKFTVWAGYVLLEPAIVGQSAGEKVKVSDFIYNLFVQFLIVAAVLAVIMIVIGGFQYITSVGDSGKVSEGKKKIKNALIGLIIALTAYALLATINPQLVNYEAVLKEDTPPAQQAQ